MSDTPHPVPAEPPAELRIGTPERSRAAEALAEHLAAKRINPTEYEHRLAACGAARTRSELLRIFVDLPAPHPALPAPVAESETAAEVAGPAGRATKPISDNATFWVNVALFVFGLIIAGLVLYGMMSWGWWVLLVVPAMLLVALFILYVLVPWRLRRAGGR